jgi:hypothetical protein
MAGFGHKQPFPETKPSVCFPIRKETFELLVAAQNDLFVGYVSFPISKRK